jgi:hypothetical protein
MKIKFLLLNLVVFGMAACSEDNNPADEGNSSAVEDILTDGTWRISYFWDSDQDETSHFSGYDFIFEANAVFTAQSTSASNTGSWSLNDSSSDDDSPEVLSLIISFASPDDFEELSEDWDIIEHSAVQIRLEHVSGEGGGTDYLTFTKN